jgi:glycosyltransferase involved in cell wall biosynthesis
MSHDIGEPRKVLHLISSRGFYGAERIVVNLAMATDRSRFIPHLALLRAAKSPNVELVETAKEKEIPAHIIACRKWIDTEALRQVRELIRQERIDIIHCHEMKGRLYGLLSAIGTQARIMTTNHNWIRSSFRVAFFESLDAFYIRFFPKIVAVSPEVRNLMRRYLIPDGKIQVIVNGIDMNEFQRNRVARDAIRKEFCADRKVPLIGAFGRISPEKGQKYFVAAAAKVLEVSPEARFIIVGSGPQGEAMMDQAARLGITDRMIFAGFRKNIAEFYSALDLFVLPSLMEGTPMSLLEAMSSELPVIATRVGGVSRIIQHEENGLLVPPGSAEELAAAIIRLLQNADEMKSLSKKAYQTVCGKYSSKRMVDEYMDMYATLIRNDRRV